MECRNGGKNVPRSGCLHAFASILEKMRGGLLFVTATPCLCWACTSVAPVGGMDICVKGGKEATGIRLLCAPCSVLATKCSDGLARDIMWTPPPWIPPPLPQLAYCVNSYDASVLLVFKSKSELSNHEGVRDPLRVCLKRPHIIHQSAQVGGSYT